MSRTCSAELAERVHATRRGALVIAETSIGDRRPIEEWGHDAQWDDSFHHALHVLLTGERDGYYEGYGTVADLARAFEETPPERLVFCASNHDQIGNRAFGDRLPPAVRRLAAACLLFAPQVPLLFQGDENGESRPSGSSPTTTIPRSRRPHAPAAAASSPASLGSQNQDLPDPQAHETFEVSKIRPESGDHELQAFYTDLIARRALLPRKVETEVDEAARVLRVRRGNAELIADFAHLSAQLRNVG